MASSNSWEDPDWEDAKRGLLPAGVDERASTSLRSPQFQQSKPEDLAGESADAVRQVGALPEAERPTILHRRASAVDVEEQIQQRDQAEADRQQRDAERERERELRAIDRSGPYQGGDGSWKVQRADEAGNVFELPAERVAKVDRGTGEKYFDDALGGRVVVGRDETLAERAKLLEARRILQGDQQAEEAGLADLRAQMEPVKEELKAYGKEPENLAATIKRLREGMNPAAPNAGALKMLASKEKQLADWHRQNPDYAAKREQLDSFERDLGEREARKQERRWAILGTMSDAGAASRLALRPRAMDNPDDERLVVTPAGDVSAKAVDAAAAKDLLTNKEQLTQTTATARVLEALKKQGVKSVGGKAIDEQLAAVTPKKPLEFDEFKSSEGFQSAPDKAGAVKQWVEDVARYKKATDPKFDEKAWRGRFVDRGWLGEIGAALYTGTADMLPAAVGHIARALSGGVSLRGKAWYDQLIDREEKEAQSRPQSFKALAGDEIHRQIAQGVPSMPLSVVSQALGYLGGRVVGTVGGFIGGTETGPGALATSAAGRAVGAKLGAFVTTGAVFGVMSKDQFEQQARDYFLKQNPSATEEQWQAWQKAHNVDGNAWMAGTAEGLSEGVGSAIDWGIAKAGIRGLPKSLVAKWGQNALSKAALKVAPVVGALGMSYGQEAIEETVSGLFSNLAEKNTGIGKGKGIGEIFHEQGLPGGMAGLLQGGVMMGAQALLAGSEKQATTIPGDPNAAPVDPAVRVLDVADQLGTALGAAEAKAATARREGDAAAIAQAEDEVTALHGELHRAGTLARASVPAPVRAVLARMGDAQADVEGDEKRLAEDSTLPFVAAAIGEAVGLAGQRGAAVQAVAAKAGVTPELAQFVAEQHAGLAAIRDLDALAEGKPIDGQRAAVLQTLGLVEPTGQAQLPDGRLTAPMGWRITDDAVPLLAPALRAAIQATPERFDIGVTPLETADFLNHLVRSGRERLSRVAQASKARAAVVNPAEGGKVSSNGKAAPSTPATGGGSATVGGSAQPGGANVARSNVAERLSALRAGGIEVREHENGRGTAVSWSDDGALTLTWDWAEVAGNPAKAAAGLDEEIRHIAGLLALKRKWKEQGAASPFGEWLAEEGRDLYDDTRARWAKLQGAEKKVVGDAMLAAFNLYRERLEVDRARVTTVEDALDALQRGVELEGGGTMDGFAFVWEFARQISQLRQRDQITEETFGAFAAGKIGEWVRAALAALREFVRSGAFKGSQLMALVEATEQGVARFEQYEQDRKNPSVGRRESGPAQSKTTPEGTGPSGAVADGPVADAAGTAERGAGAALHLGGEVIPTAGEWGAKNPRGPEVVRGRWALVPLRLLGINKGFGTDQDRINREKSGAVQRAEIIQNMTAENIPLAWGGSASLNDGSPIITPDGSVVVGNNRTMALRDIYRGRGNERKAENYRAFALAEAQRLGLDVSKVGTEPVVLVRVVDDAAGLERNELVKAANVAGIQAKSDAETALADAPAMDNAALMATLNPGEDGNLNRDFLASFYRMIGAPETLRLDDGGMDPGKVGRRAQNAMLARLLTGAPNFDRVLAQLTDAAGQEGMKRTLAGVYRALPGLLKIQQSNPDLGILRELGRALGAMPDYREKLAAGTVANVEDYLAQQDLFEKPLEARLLRLLAGNVGTQVLADELNAYVRAVESYGDPNQERMFPEPAPDRDTLAGRLAMRREAARELREALGMRQEPLDARIVAAAERKGKPLNIDPAWGLPAVESVEAPPSTMTRDEKGTPILHVRTAVLPETIVADDEGRVIRNPLLDHLPAGVEVTRARLHRAIGKHYGRLADKAKKLERGEILFTGGGPAAGKSTFIKEMEAAGQIPPKDQRVTLSADDIKMLIPEMQQLMAAGNPNAAHVVHSESQLIFDNVVQMLLREFRNIYIVWDATLSVPDGILPKVAKFKAAGFRTHLRGILIDPWEAVVRAAVRGVESGRFIPYSGILWGHRGWHGGWQRYLGQFDTHEIRGVMFGDEVYRPGGEGLRQIVVASTEREVDSEAAAQYVLSDERAKLQDQAPGRESLFASYAPRHPAGTGSRVGSDGGRNGGADVERTNPASGLGSVAGGDGAQQEGVSGLGMRRDPRESAAFRGWFGNSVVTEDERPGGEPVRLVHGTGTPDAFDVFNLSARGFIYAATNPQYAEGFGARYRDDANQMIPVYARVERPLDLRALGTAEVSFERVAQLLEAAGVDTEGLEDALGAWSSRFPAYKLFHTRGFAARLRRAGYDGAVMWEANRLPAGERKGQAWVMMDPAQLKSAIANSGAYSREDRSILAMRRGDSGTMDLFSQPATAAAASNYFAHLPDQTKPAVKAAVKRDGLGVVEGDLFAFAAQNPPKSVTSEKPEAPRRTAGQLRRLKEAEALRDKARGIHAMLEETSGETYKRLLREATDLFEQADRIEAEVDAAPAAKPAPVVVAPQGEAAVGTQPGPADSVNERKSRAADTVATLVQGILDQPDGRAISWEWLFRQYGEALKGSQANGDFTPKDAYDALELGINRYLLRHYNSQQFSLPADASAAVRMIGRIKGVIARVPTQTKRTTETDEFQQFSTIPSLAFVANWVAKLGPSDVVLEPSAGIGGLGVYAKLASADVVLNELSERRAAILRKLDIGPVFTENAEYINAVLPKSVKPTVVVMNPPFSATAGRMMNARDTANATKHLESALAALPEGGRLVAIVGEGMAMDRPAFRGWWQKMGAKYAVRANVVVNGQEYAKYGTTFDNAIIVIDKVAPTGAAPVTGRVEQVEDLVELLAPVRYARPYPSEQFYDNTDSSDSSPAGGTRGGTQRTDSDQPVGPGAGGNAAGAAGDGLGGGADAQQPGASATGVRGENPAGGSGADSGLDQRSSAGANAAGDSGSGNAGVAGAGQFEARRDLEVNPEAVFDQYVPRVTYPGSTMPPVEVQESAAMAAIDPQRPTYEPALGKEFYQPQNGASEGRLSALAMEFITLAGNAHQAMVPAAFTEDERKEWRKTYGSEPPTEFRRAAFCGDGTGMGKGRQVSGVIMDNWLQGRTKAVWISEKPGLVGSARRDMADVSPGMESKIFEVSATKAGEKIQRGQGVAFLSYATLRSEEKTKDSTKAPQSRVDQLVAWLGEDFDGVIAFDEAHNMANAIGQKKNRGVTKPSRQALAGIELQRRLPKARVIYVSATGATEVSNLSYAERLGLWGMGTPFANIRDFIGHVASRGTAAMELVAQNLKAMGLYVARSISWRGIEYRPLEHKLTDDQRAVYDEMAKAWQMVLGRMDEALRVIGAVGDDPRTGEERTLNKDAKATARSKFWGAHQRFFNQIITAMKMPTVLESVEREVAQGNAVVIQLVNTNEASQDRAIAKKRADAAENNEALDLEDLDMTPRDQLLQMVQAAFPVFQQEEFTDADGNVGWRTAKDSKGNPIVNPEAVAMREQLLTELAGIRVPDGPLELLLNRFGAENVAEITGRGQRVVWGKDKSGQRAKIIEKRGKNANQRDEDDFAKDKKRILFFSNAGGTGRSYHADRKIPNRRKRVHILLQPGWRADQAIQGMGRTHRNNQQQPPEYILATTDVVGEKRFISSIARRLDQLGALTKGQRETASQGMFKASDNLESPQAHAALERFYADVLSGRVEGLGADVLEREMGLKLRDRDGNPVEQRPPITQFLNRLLSLTLDTQEKVFAAFAQRVDRIVQAERDAGTLDQGVEVIAALKATPLEDQVIHTDARTGAQARYVKLELTQPTEFYDFEPKAQHGYWLNVRSKRIYASVWENTTTEDDGAVVRQAYLRGTRGSRYENTERLTDEKAWQKIDRRGAERMWREEVEAAPKTYIEQKHFLTGTLLPVWDRFAREVVVTLRKVKLDDGRVLIGVPMHDDSVQPVMRNFGIDAETAKPTVEQAVAALDAGGLVRLSNDWRLKSVRVSGERRVELLGPSTMNHAELESLGIFPERIQWSVRYFVPADNVAGVLEALARNGRDTVEVKHPRAALAMRRDTGTMELWGNSQRVGNLPTNPAPSVAELVRGNLGLAVSIANQFANIKAPMDDIVSAARSALVKAARAYDPGRGNFPAFAGTAIRNALMDFHGVAKRYAQRHATTLDEAAEGMDEEETRKDRVTRNAGGEEAAGPVAAIEQADTARELADAIAKLPERPRMVLQRVARGDTLEAIGADFGVSQQAVSKMAANARKAVAGILRNRGFKGVDPDGVLYMRREGREALGRKLIELAGHPGAFRLEVTPEQRAAQSLQQALAAFHVRSARINPSTGTRGVVIVAEDGSQFLVKDKGNDQIAVNSMLGRGPNSSAIYQAIYTWAFNTGRMVVPDDSYSPEGMVRRMSQMLSSALRHGTTRHMQPHRGEVIGLNAWDTTDTAEAFANNVGLLAAEEMEAVLRLRPDLQNVWSAHDTDSLLSEVLGAPALAGETVERLNAFTRQVEAALDRENQKGGDGRVGPSTALRTLLVDYWIRSNESKRGVELAADLPARLKREAFYMRREADPGEPLPGMANAGMPGARGPAPKRASAATSSARPVTSFATQLDAIEREMMGGFSDAELREQKKRASADEKTKIEAEEARRAAGERRDQQPGLWRDFYNAHFRGNRDKIEYFAPGAGAVLADMERETALVNAALREFRERMETAVQESFGFPSWWRQPAVRARLARFQARLLPVAARLNATRVDDEGRLVFGDFWMRAGVLSEKEATRRGLVTGNLAEIGGESLRIGALIHLRRGELIDDAEAKRRLAAGEKIDSAYQLERWMPRDVQARVHEQFHADFPEAAHWLDAFIAPGREAERITDARGVVLPAFNRGALRSFYGEASPYGTLASLPGYTPDVARTRSLAGMVGSLLTFDWQSPARRYKTGEARERGEVRGLMEGFNLRAAQAHEETMRRKTAEALLRTATRDLPPDGAPEGWRKLDRSFFNPLVRAARAAGMVEENQLPLLPEDVSEDALTAANLETVRRLVGDAGHFNPQRMVRQEIFEEIVRQFASTRINNRFLALLNALSSRMTLGYLTSPYTWVQNFVSNEIFKSMRAMQRASYGVLRSLAGDRREGRVALREARYIVQGLVWDRWWNPAWREKRDAMAPLELFERQSGLRAIGDDALDKPASDYLKEANVPAAILKAVRYGDMDARAKQQLANAAYRAAAAEALHEWERDNGKVSDRETWMRDWVQAQPPEVHRSIRDAAALYTMDYANVPALLDEKTRVEIRGVDVTPVANMIRRLAIPFGKYPYNYARQLKRLGVDSVLDVTVRRRFKTKRERANATANLVMLTGLMLAARLALGGGDDDDETSRIGTAYDEQGNVLESAFNTGSRVNISGTPLGFAVRVAARMAGADTADTDDYWMRVRTVPYANVALLLSAAETSLRAMASPEADQRGARENLADNLQSMFEDFVSTGLGLQMAMAATGYRNKYEENLPTSVMLGRSAVDLTTGGVAPAALRDTAARLADPITRRVKPAKSLDYHPGFVEGVASHVPGLTRTLPPAGRVVARTSPDNWKATMARAVLEQKGMPGAVRDYVDPKTGKPYTSYVNPDTVRARPRWLEAIRALGLNVKPIDRAGYAREVKGLGSELDDAGTR